MRAYPGGGGDAGRGVAHALPSPRGRGVPRRARTASTRGLTPALLQPGREAKRRRTEADVEHGRERRPPDSHVGTVEDPDDYQPDRPARAKACGGEEEQ